VAPAWPLHHPLGDGLARDGTDESAKAAGAVGDIGRAGHGEGRVLGGEGPAVMPWHALAQLELPDGGLDGAPRGGEARDELRIGRAVGQRVEDVQRQRGIRRGIEEMRIERGDGAAGGDRQAGAGRCLSQSGRG